MPHVINIQDWADDLELYRLPMLNTRLLAEEADRIDADNGHSARITSAQDSANDARDRADTANTRIYQTGLDARIYTDDEIQKLRDDLLGHVALEIEQRGNQWAAELEQEIQDRIDAAVEHADNVANETREELNTARGTLDVLFGLTNGVIDEDFPLTRAAAEAALEVANNGKAVVESIFEGFTYPSAMAGIDASFFAANNANTAKDLAEAHALAASNSASSSVGASSIAVTKAGEAALSAMAAAASVTRASTGSTKVVPSQITDDDWRHALAGAPAGSGLHEEVVAGAGFVTVPATDTADINFVTQIVLQWLPERAYRMQVLARTSTANNALAAIVAPLSGAYTVVGSPIITEFGVLDGTGEWVILSYDFITPAIPPGVTYFRIGVQAREASLPDAAIDIQAIILEDVTQMLSIEGYAEAAVSASEQVAVAQNDFALAASAAFNKVAEADTHAQNAWESAQAAAGFAGTAEAAEDPSGELATSAFGYAARARTRAGEAQASATAAATSASNANGSAVAASNSAQVSVTARSETVIASGATGFELGLEGWSTTPDVVTPLFPPVGVTPGWSVVLAKGRGTCLRGPGDGDYFYTARTFHLIPERRYKIRASMSAGRSTSSPGVVRLYAGYIALDADGVPIGNRVWNTINNVSRAWADSWLDAVSESFSLAEIQELRPGAVSIKLAGLMNFNRTDLNIFGVCDGIWLEDVTDLLEVKASVVQTSTALSDLSGAIAGFQWIAKAGPSNGAGIEAISIAPNGETTSETLLLHGNVMAPQTISTAQLTVTELDYNKVPDNQLQYRPLWETGNWSLRTPGSTWAADSLGELRWTYAAGGSGNVSNTGAPFKVEAGQTLVCGFQCRRISGTQMSAYAILRFADQAGTLISGGGGSVTIGTAAPTVNSWTHRYGAEVTVPEGAHLAYWRWVVNQDGTNGSVGFFAPKVTSKINGATLITPESITTPLLVANAVTVEKLDMIGLRAVNAWIGRAAIIDAAINRAKIQDGEIIRAKIADAAIDRAKIANAAIGEAQIGDLEVTTIKIKGGSLGRSFTGSRSSNVELNDTGVWENILSLTMPSNLLPAGATARVLVNFFTYVRLIGSVSHEVGMRILIGGSTIFSDEYGGGSGTDRIFISGSPIGSVANGQTIQFQQRRASGGVADVSKANLSAFILFQAG